ncbi:MAG: SDR family oxidoreductase [Myxococcales bacterium]|nr:SDR family oxidoreductase [Myxococcales bacterium]
MQALSRVEAPEAAESSARRAPSELSQRFDLTGKVAVITGGAGLLGQQHARAIWEAGGTPVLADVAIDPARAAALRLVSAKALTPVEADLEALVEARVGAVAIDVTNEDSLRAALGEVVSRHGRVDILINNAANNPKMEDGSIGSTRLEQFDLARWHADLEVGLTGAFLCAKVFGSHMAEQGGGVILNIASDLGLIAPDQRIYRVPGLPESEQPVKPVTYSVVKGGLVMLTKYLATYWAERGVRVNSLSPGGMRNGQPEDFVERLTNLIPMGRMAEPGEYEAAVLFLCSAASSYMTGANLVIDGGRTCW